MKTILTTLFFVFFAAQCVFGAGSASDYEVQKVANGIYAVIRKEPPSLWFNPNNVFIVGKDSVIVIDSNISSEYTRAVLAELKKITDKPVKYVVNTHWHEDHIIGNRVYQDAFPGVQFIGHRSTLNDLSTIGAANRKDSVENGKGFSGYLKNLLAKGKNLDGKEITEEEKQGYASDVKLVESYMAESSDFKIILPTVIVDEKLELNDGNRKIQILHLGKAHTGADLAVYLPKEKILISGDLVVSPIPLIGSTSYPLDYAVTLENLLKLKHKLIIPGHGPVMRDDVYAWQMIGLLKSIKHQVEQAVARGENLEQLRKSFNLDEFKKLFAGDSQHKRFVYENYVFLPATAAAYEQLTKKK